MKKFAVIYLHVSDESEVKGQDLYSQAIHCQEYARTHGYTVYDPVFIDDSRKIANQKIKRGLIFTPLGREY